MKIKCKNDVKGRQRHVTLSCSNTVRNVSTEWSRAVAK